MGDERYQWETHFSVNYLQGMNIIFIPSYPYLFPGAVLAQKIWRRGHCPISPDIAESIYPFYKTGKI